MSRTVCVVTGTRAEFGLLRMLMAGVQADPQLRLQVIATGMHLSPEYGYTYQEIEEAGFSIDCKVEMLLSADTSSAVTKSTGLGLIGFADAYQQLKPDVVVVLGDRFEILAAVTAALIAGIPVAHLHGGETTEGAFDEAIRHSITKMSHLHFVAAQEYRNRVIQLGEAPERVFLVGGLGVDAIRTVPLLDRSALQASLGFEFRQKNLLITFHPVTLDSESSAHQMRELLAALGDLHDTGLIFTLPNADTGSRELRTLIEHFVKTHAHAAAYTSLGQLRYLSTMKQVDAVVGNSSSGLAEAPSLGVATLNIGDRQKGRLQASSVVNCEPVKSEIIHALERVYSESFRESLKAIHNPYDHGGATEKIVEIIKSHPLQGITKKAFYNLPVGSF